MLESIVSIATCPSSLSIFAITLVVVYGIKSWLSHPSEMPPMPRLPVPILGHIPFMTPSPTDALDRWRKKKGDLFTIYIGGAPNVVINSYELLHEAFVKQADIFSDRPKTVRVHFEGFNVGIGENNGEPWKEQRGVSMSILRSFGMGKTMMAKNITNEVDTFINELSAMKGEPHDVRTLLKLTFANIISLVLLGTRFDYKEPHLHNLMKQVDIIFRAVGPANLLYPFPVLRFLPGDLFGAKAVVRAHDDLLDFFREFVKTSAENKDDLSSDNYIKAYLREMHKRRESGQHTYLDEENLRRNMDNLYLTGCETGATTILWAMVFALRNPDVQTKLYKEIEEKIGTEKVPDMDDKPKLNYVNAFILETSRLVAIAPLGVPHVCSQTTQLGGYTIPRGTIILPNLDAVLKDPNHWTDPLEFRPERFLDKDNNLVSNPKMVAFSLGRRICPGESLAKMELFLYVAALFQRFEIVPEVPNQPPSMECEFGITVAPVPFKVRFKPRNN